MKIYLIRHGEAVSAAEDEKRPLSENGFLEVRKVAQFLAANAIHVEHIYHSGILRAAQTAEALAKGVHLEQVEVLSGLLPDDDVKPIATTCNHWEKDAILVSHLPFLGKLVVEILFGRQGQPFFEFQAASIICLERVVPFFWNISWCIHPYLLPKNNNQ